MTRNELQNELKKLGFKRLCNDQKTLVAYNQIQYFLSCNRTPIKSIEEVYVDGGGELRIVCWGVDLEAGYNTNEERGSYVLR